MKRIFFFIVAILLCNDVKSQLVLKGKVLDKNTKEAVVGASVIIPELKIGTSTNEKGEFSFTNFSARRMMLRVRGIGYGSINVYVEMLNDQTSLELFLSPQILEKDEVVITGSAFATNHAQSSVSVDPIEKSQIQNTAATNITEALTQVAGVSSTSSGGGIAKPVIRGLGYNRIVIINEGIRQEGQQWGDEHGLEIDQFSAERVEVLKGPASLLFGSDAIGGVINILEPFPAPLGTIKGELVSQYQSNNKQYVASAMAEGNQKGLVWRFRKTNKNSAAYSTPNEVIYNSAFNEDNASLMLGINKKWGYQHFHFSSYQAQFGMIEGVRDSSGLFITHDGNSVSNDDALTRTIDLPFQMVNHYKLSSLGSYFIGKGNLRTVFGWQNNQRKEYEDDVSVPNMYIDLKTITGDLKYYFPQQNNWDIVVGISAGLQQNKNKGAAYLIPDFSSTDFGVFSSIKKIKDKWSRNFGLRYDWKSISADSLSGIFTSFERSFNAVIGSLGFTYEATDQLHFRWNAGRGFRVPNISELSANGVHEGTFRYEIGNPDLKPESSWQFDAGLGYESEKLGGEFSLFYNAFKQFIYYRNFQNQTQEVDNQLYPVFKYVQGNALFYGGELSIDYHPINQVHFGNKISYVWAVNQETKLALPFIPPFHLNTVLNYEFIKSKNTNWKSLKVNAQFDYYAKQNRIDQFETITNAYSLLSGGFSARYESNAFCIDFYLIVNNITNEVYFNHLSRLKYVGIAGMGRNLTIGCSIPFAILKNKSL
jgi:iron complex outermembrane receptor protein